MTGLSQIEAELILIEDGLNEIKRKKEKTKFEIIIEIFKDPIIIIMSIAVLISIISGIEEQHFSEAIVIGSLVLINVVINFTQEVKTIQKLNSLNQLNESKVNVIREGHEIEIASKYLVKGDLVKIKLGDVVRADMKLVKASKIQVDESFLTGESLSVDKNIDDIIFSNSPVINGSGFAEVVAVGLNTEIGKIAAKVDLVDETKSQLELKILDITKKMLIISLVISTSIFILTMLNGYSFGDSLSITISILIATVPEGLATVLAIVLTFMSQKMAHNKALAKKISLLETLGEVEYVCSDKTGTITENKMKVVACENISDSAIGLSLEKFIIDRETPTTRAINDYLAETNNIDLLNLELIDIIPFNSELKKSAYLIRKKEKKYIVVVGAPEYLLSNTEEKIKKFSDYSNQGYRTLLTMFQETEIDDFSNFELKNAKNYEIISLYGIQDPPKESAIKAIEEFHKALIKTVMITGDSLGTARAIATQAKIIETKNDLAITGEELKKLSDQEFSNIVEQVKVYARVSPDDKLRIITELQKKNKIVAMTGDGTNDSIALKKADVGIAMGIQGTDISKESADLILLDDNYATIGVAVSGGRLIFDNLQKFIKQMLTSNAAHTGSILFALLFGLFMQDNIILPMTSILILWVNVISDAIPCLAVGLDNPENDIMNRKPISREMKLLSTKNLIEIIIRGLTLGLLVFIGFNYVYNITGDEVYARTIGFSILSFGQLIHIFDARSFKTIFRKNPFENKYILYAVVLSSFLNLLIIYTPLNKVFGLTGIKLSHLLIAIVFSSLVTFVYSLIKLIFQLFEENKSYY